MMCYLAMLKADNDRSDARSSPALITYKPIGAANTTVTQLLVSSLQCGLVTVTIVKAGIREEPRKCPAGHVCTYFSVCI
jgi:hypothetical protein